jgi:hypothetical protein
MFGPERLCLNCGGHICDYRGSVFPGSHKVVNVDSGSWHTCFRVRECHPERLGQVIECLCGVQVHRAPDGVKLEMDGSPHFCLEHVLDSTPKAAPVHVETADQIARGFVPAARVRPKAETAETPTAIPNELKRMLDGFR